MRHSAFFEALAEAPEGGEKWNQIIVGYYLIRALEDWCECGPENFSLEEGVDQIRIKIEQLTPFTPPFVNVFQESLRTLITTTEWNIVAVVPPFIAYASLLESSSDWALAADVYGSIADRLRGVVHNRPTDVAALGFTRRREAFALRNLGEFDLAEDRYLEAAHIASRTKDAQNSVYARIGLSGLYRVKGNLPASLSTLTALLTDYEAGAYSGVEGALSEILHNRGAVRTEMNQHDLAILDFFAAYRASRDPDLRDQILNDLAAAAGRKGYHDLARKVFELIIRRSEIAHRRQFAIVNMLFFAAMTGDKIVFTTYRRQWHPDSCDAALNAAAWLAVAQATERFGTKAEALEAYQTAVTFAAQKHIHKIEFDALQRLEELRAQSDSLNVYAELTQVLPIPVALATVADALSHEYILAAEHREA